MILSTCLILFNLYIWCFGADWGMISSYRGTGWLHVGWEQLSTSTNSNKQEGQDSLLLVEHMVEDTWGGQQMPLGLASITCIQPQVAGSDLPLPWGDHIWGQGEGEESS